MAATQGWIECEAGSFPLLYTSPIRWTLREGVNPAEEEFDMVPEHAELVLGSSPDQPVSLRLQTDLKKVVIKNLWIEGKRGSSVPYFTRIKLSDRRRFFKYGNILGRYNIRREVGINRVAVTGEDVIDPVVPEIWFAPYSLKGYAPNKVMSDTDRWNVVDMIQDVMRKATQTEKDFSKGEVPGLTLTQEILDLKSAMSLEGLQIDDSSDFGVQRALGYLPEAGLTVDPDGKFVIYSKVSGKDSYYAGLIQPELENRGHLALINNANVRPKKIEVFFTIECEVRFDYIESEDSELINAVQNNDYRLLDNVAPSPDWTMSMGGETVVQGTWKTIDQFLNNWSPKNPWGLADPISRKFLLQALCPYLDLWAPFGLSGLSSPDVDWASRAAMLQHHMRTTFRVPPRWMNNIFQLVAERVGIVDQTTGSRGPAEAFCDYYKVATQRAFFKSKNGDRPGQKGEYAVNVTGYPTGAAAIWNPFVNEFDDSTKAVPAKVLLIDPDQGIFHLEWMADGFRLYEMLGPSKIVQGNGSDALPSRDWTSAAKTPVSFDAIFSEDVIPQLASEQKMAVIMTAIPASPNDTRQLFKITVNPEDVKDIVPATVRTSLGKCYGPTWQVRVGGGMDGARAMIPWVDKRYADIEKLFGVQDGEPKLDDLVLNFQKPRTGIQAASLTTIAKAVASRVWSRYSDRFAGSASGTLNPDILVDGWVGAVTHGEDADGTASTAIALPESLPDLPWYSLLDSSTRAILFREVRPRK